MTKTHKMIPLKDLNLTNRFLFDEVMEDPETHQAVLNIIFATEISPLLINQTEKEGRLSPSIRSIRMDVYAMKLREMIEKKLRKGKSLDVIADELEEDFSVIEEIVREVKKNQ